MLVRKQAHANTDVFGLFAADAIIYRIYRKPLALPRPAVVKYRMAELRENLDMLIYLAVEAPLQRGEVLDQIRDLFPHFNPDQPYHDETVDELFLEMYAYYRQLGLSFAEVAYKLECSEYKLTEMIYGKGLSLNSFLALAKRELYAVAELKSNMLKPLEEKAKSGDVKSAVMLLEKLLPEEFAPRQKLDLNPLAEAPTSLECEDKALKARERLLQLRKERQETEASSEL